MKPASGKKGYLIIDGVNTLNLSYSFNRSITAPIPNCGVNVYHLFL
jgi:hypothetical protein